MERATMRLCFGLAAALIVFGYGVSLRAQEDDVMDGAAVVTGESTTRSMKVVLDDFQLDYVRNLYYPSTGRLLLGGSAAVSARYYVDGVAQENISGVGFIMLDFPYTDQFREALEACRSTLLLEMTRGEKYFLRVQGTAYAPSVLEITENSVGIKMLRLNLASGGGEFGCDLRRTS